MTREQLIAALREFTGMRIDDVGDRLGRELRLVSPNGRIVCTMSIFEGAEGWMFGGVGGGFPDDWKALCRLHEVAK